MAEQASIVTVVSSVRTKEWSKMEEKINLFFIIIIYYYSGNYSTYGRNKVNDLITVSPVGVRVTGKA